RAHLNFLLICGYGDHLAFRIELAPILAVQLDPGHLLAFRVSEPEQDFARTAAGRRRDLRLDVALINVGLDVESRLAEEGGSVLYPDRPTRQKPGVGRPGAQIEPVAFFTY